MLRLRVDVHQGEVPLREVRRDVPAHELGRVRVGDDDQVEAVAEGAPTALGLKGKLQERNERVFIYTYFPSFLLDTNLLICEKTFKNSSNRETTGLAKLF